MPMQVICAQDGARTRSPAAAHTFLFADLCGFTEFTTRHGDELAADLAIAFHERVRELASNEGCDVVKAIGDAVMVRSADCARAVRLACRILALGGCGGYPPIRIGLDSGPATERDGDWYGTTVNTAARVADAATPGQLLVTDRARTAMHGADCIALAARGAHRLKGLPVLTVHAAAAA
ncbi:MAG: adenylate/guanylate cyclase domain-containing protein [Actinomycetota bacterium]|nr:adenylate/guanylate cyclase domain-containing protein [Actinomycetota bacterium]